VTDTPPISTSGCNLDIEYQYSTDTVRTLSCSATWSDGTERSYSFPLHVEVSSPSVSAAPSRPPDSNDWYNHPVSVSFTGTSFSRGVSCTPTTTFAGPDEMNATVSGSCTDNAGKTTPASVVLNYDSTPPTITGWTPSRPPDLNGWYNHPVSFAFTGADSVSGIDSCTTATYSGPDSAQASVVGTCRDRAGNMATEAVPIKYDATPPSLRAFVSTGDEDVHVGWQSSTDPLSLTISRSPGLHGAADSVVDRGGNGTFNDARVRNGVRYTYTITARDQAGNVAVRMVHATPGPHLLFPVGGTQVASPPLLAWTPVRHSTYYNVQLYRDGRKVFSLWPSHPELVLSLSWTFSRHRYALKPGRYRWYVWPGFGSRQSARYGSLIGAGMFVVARRTSRRLDRAGSAPRP
jgi:hypothetical protein